MHKLRSGIGLFCLAFVACAGSQAPESENSVEPQAEIAAADAEAGEQQAGYEWQQKLIKQKDDRIKELEYQVSDLVEQLEFQQSETQRFEEGLGRAVDELNKVAGERNRAHQALQSIPLSSPSPRRSSSGGGGDSISIWSERVNLMGNFAQVRGRLYNRRGSEANITLTATLLLDGSVVGERDTSLRIPGRSFGTFSVQIPIRSGAQGTYSTQVRIR